MKKLILLFGVLARVSMGQSVILDPSINTGTHKINTAINIPGFVHNGNTAGTPSLGTVIKSDGPYLQTFTNNTLNFGTNNFLTNMTINQNGNVQNSTFTNFGSASTSIRQIKITGFTDAYDGINASTNDGVPYYNTYAIVGFPGIAISSVDLIIDAGGASFVPQEYQSSPGYQAAVSWDETTIYISNYPLNSSLVRNKAFKLLVTYRQLL
jgi:hypothetical protein